MAMTLMITMTKMESQMPITGKFSARTEHRNIRTTSSAIKMMKAIGATTAFTQKITLKKRNKLTLSGM